MELFVVEVASWRFSMAFGGQMRLLGTEPISRSPDTPKRDLRISKSLRFQTSILNSADYIKFSIKGLWDREEAALLFYIDFEIIQSEMNLFLRLKNAVSAYLRGVRISTPSAFVYPTDTNAPVTVSFEAGGNLGLLKSS
jgi:hypothetical protein